MPKTNYLNVTIGNLDVDVENAEAFPLAISYELEDADNFEQKKGTTAFDVTLPATHQNGKAANTFFNPSIEDLSAGEFFKSHQKCVITANGVPLLTGKAFLKQATHTDRPETFTFDIYSGNADWLIELKDLTLLDCVNPDTHLFNGTKVTDSFAFDGRSETLDYVYAPVRYLQPFHPYNGQEDVVVTIFELKPSISIYWLLYRAFKSIGYQINSVFLDSDYFRRLVMPWTWGSFLYTEDTLFAPLSFRAVCTHRESVINKGGSWNEWVSPTSATVNEIMQWSDVTSGGIDGGFQGMPGLYQGPGTPSFPNNHDLNYYYPAGSALGTIAMGFELQVYYALYVPSGNSSWGLRAVWFINGTQVAIDLIVQQNGHGTTTDSVNIRRELILVPGDILTCAMRIDATAGITPMTWAVGAPYPTIPSSANYPPSFFRNTYIKKAVDTPVSFKQYAVFQKYKTLDLIRGLADAFNLSFSADAVNKTVTIEPTHGYNTGAGNAEGYLRAARKDWTAKQDLSKESVMELYSDNERQFDFKLAEDPNDGGVKIINQRYGMETGASRYIFPDRFQTGTKEFTNRFFSPVAHMFFTNWGGVTGASPQIIALIPENISNTSSAEDENAFAPKLAYYKGNTGGVGGWFFQFDPNNPATLAYYGTFPFMFAVNYQPGGESDPVLTYSDQAIYPPSGSTAIIGQGLMRRFFLTRLATMRAGRRYSTWFNLTITDVEGGQQREAIIIKNATFYVLNITNFLPLASETTAVTLWKHEAPSLVDSDACFPSFASVKRTITIIPKGDLKYNRNFITNTDIPTNGSA